MSLKPTNLIKSAQRAGLRVPGLTRQNLRERESAARTEPASAAQLPLKEAYTNVTGRDRDWELAPPPPDYPDHISTAKADALGIKYYDLLNLSRLEDFFNILRLDLRELRENRMYACILLHTHPVHDSGYYLDYGPRAQKRPPKLIYAASRPLVTGKDSPYALQINNHILIQHLKEEMQKLPLDKRDHFEIIHCQTHRFGNDAYHITSDTNNFDTFMSVYAAPHGMFEASLKICQESEKFMQDWQSLRQAAPQAAAAIDYLGATRATCGDTGKRHLMQRRDRPSP